MRTVSLTLVCALLALPLASCSSSSISSVDLAAENQPPIGATVSGKGISVPAGIGVAFVVTVYVDGKKTDDPPYLPPEQGCVAQLGTGKNEVFMVCDTPGQATLLIQDGDHIDDYGQVEVPVTVTAQPGTVILDAGPPDVGAPDGAAPDAASE
jgi:hypothetical protein